MLKIEEVFFRKKAILIFFGRSIVFSTFLNIGRRGSFTGNTHSSDSGFLLLNYVYLLEMKSMAKQY